MISPEATLSLARNITLNHKLREAMGMRGEGANSSAKHGAKVSTRLRFEALLRQLHAAIKPYMPNKDGSPAAVRDPGFVKAIHISTFGFSRGATQARF